MIESLLVVIAGVLVFGHGVSAGQPLPVGSAQLVVGTSTFSPGGASLHHH